MLVQADARHIPLADQSVQMVCTSPPYWGLRDYGLGADCLGLEPTPELYVAHMVEVFREVRRVLRDDGTCWLNLGDSYARQAGSNETRGTPNTGQANPLRMAMEPRGNNRPPPGLKPKDLVGIPWRVAFALQADGWWLRSDIIWHKPNPMPESVTDRPTKSHEYMFLLTKSKRYFYDAEAVKEASTQHPADWNANGTQKRLSHKRGEFGGKNTDTGKEAFRTITPTRNRRTVWTISTKPYKGAHFATYPPALVEPCILAGSAVGDVVLDPFCGSGTTGMVAIKHGREFVGLDLNGDYLSELATERTDKVQLAMIPT